MQLSVHFSKESRAIRWNHAIWYTVKDAIFEVSKYIRRRGIAFPKHSRSRFNLKEHVKVLGIFRSNAFDLGSHCLYQQAVFNRTSRINHSCVPNAQGNFDDTLSRFNIHATRDIKTDEELTLNYLQEEGAARESRQSRLLSGYGFTCDCPACDLTSSQGRLGEENRLHMHQKLAEFAGASEGAGNSITQKLEVERQTIKSFILLLEGEKIAGRELSTLYLEATKLNEELGNYAEALYSAERALEIDQDCLGTDHTLYLETLETVQSLKLRTESRN